MSNKVRESNYTKKIIDFGMDKNGNPDWGFYGYDYDDIGAVCEACGHNPIKNVYYVNNLKTGTIAKVGSECIEYVVGMDKKKAITRIVQEISRKFNNKIRNEELLGKYEKFFYDNPSLINTTTGEGEIIYKIDSLRCNKKGPLAFAKEHENCSDFMKNVCKMQTDGQLLAVERYGCKTCKQSFKKWQKQRSTQCNIKSTVYQKSDLPTLCEPNASCVQEIDDNIIRWSGENILECIRDAYKFNYFDIDFIFYQIEQFNTHQVETNTGFNGGLPPIKIPAYEKRNFKERPLTDVERKMKAELTKERLEDFKKQYNF